MEDRKVPVTAEVARNLLHPRFCGLFDSDVVRKHPALAAREYWIEPSVHPRLQRIIVERVMPVVEQWTHGAWVRVGARSARTFNWVAHIPSNYSDYGGIAVPGGDASLNNYEQSQGLAMPEEIICNNGLHEAAHALFHAVHSEQGGLMCNDGWWAFSQTITARAGGSGPAADKSWDWRWRGPVSRLEHKVYAAYGNPIFKDGMAKSEVADKLEVVRNSGIKRWALAALLAAAVIAALYLYLDGAGMLSSLAA